MTRPLSRPTAPPDCWLHPAVEVRESAIDGGGLFTRQPLAAGVAVVRFGGRVVTRDELLALFDEAARDPEAPYIDCTSIDEGFDLVMPPNQDVHFGNHSCDPNMWHADAFALVARRDIQADEELTVDYATHSDGDLSLSCRCGAPLCRGSVTGDDWRLSDLQARYSDHWVPALVRRIQRSTRSAN